MLTYPWLETSEEQRLHHRARRLDHRDTDIAGCERKLAAVSRPSFGRILAIHRPSRSVGRGRWYRVEASASRSRLFEPYRLVRPHLVLDSMELVYHYNGRPERPTINEGSAFRPLIESQESACSTLVTI